MQIISVLILQQKRRQERVVAADGLRRGRDLAPASRALLLNAAVTLPEHMPPHVGIPGCQPVLLPR